MLKSDEERAEAKEATKAADSHEKSWWQGWLPYLGGLVAFIALVGSLITFSISKTIEIYHQITWKEKVTVISYRSEGPQVFLNTGDGQVFLSHMHIQSETDSMTRTINSIIKPGEFYTLPLQANPNIDRGGLVSGIDEDQWKNLLERYRTKEKGSMNPSLFMVYYSLDSPALQVYKRRLKETLRTVSATGTLVYFSANEGKRFEQTLPLEGTLVMKPETTDTK